METPTALETEPVSGPLPTEPGAADREWKAKRRRPLPSPSARRIPPSTAAITRPFLVILPILTLLVPGLLIAFTRQPVYSAEARMLVGNFDVASQAVPGVVEASRSLAETYSRLIGSDAITARTAAELGISPAEVQGNLSASSIPGSSIIRVRGTGESTEEAARLANAGADALVEYASSGEGDEAEALARYEEALLAVRTAEVEIAAIEDEIDAAVAALATAAAADARERLAQAQADADRARLQAETLAEEYLAASGSGGSSHLRVVGEAVDTGSDRRSVLQLAVGSALVLGFIIGIALATVVVNREYLTGRQDPAR